MYGFHRLSAAVPLVRVADFAANREHTLGLWRQAHDEGNALVVFPELGLSGYTARDLFLDHHLLQSCQDSLLELAEAGRELRDGLLGVGLAVGRGAHLWGHGRAPCPVLSGALGTREAMLPRPRGPRSSPRGESATVRLFVGPPPWAPAGFYW